jgi:hypothetical protein
MKIMKVKDLFENVLLPNAITLLDIEDGEYVGIFAAECYPVQYAEWDVTGVTSDYFDGDGPFDGSVVKVWIKKPEDEE